jgi:hypothetical protein
MQISPRYIPLAFVTGALPRIDWTNPITNGLLGVWMPGIIQCNLVDAAFLQLRDSTNTYPFAGPFGAEYVFNKGNSGTNGNKGFQSNGPAYLSKAGGVNWSIYGLVRVISGASTNLGGANIYGERASSGNDIIKLDWEGSDVPASKMEVTLRNDAGTLLRVKETTSSTDNLYHSWLATKLGNGGSGNLILYRDGIQNTTGNWTGTDSYTDAGMTATVGYDVTVTTLDGAFPGAIVIIAVWNRVLNPTEAFQLYADPFCLLEFPEQTIASTLTGVPFVFILMPQIVT